MSDLVERLAEKWKAWVDSQPEMSDEDIVRFILNAIADKLEHEALNGGESTSEKESWPIMGTAIWLRSQASDGGDDEVSG